MTFQAYLDSIHAKTGLGPDDFRRVAAEKGYLDDSVKVAWRPTYDTLLSALRKLGPVDEAATNTYISLLRGTAKFAIVAVTTDRLDIGIKLKGEAATDRVEESGAWNTMVTHRVRVTDTTQLDPELLGWLQRAYDAAGTSARR